MNQNATLFLKDEVRECTTLNQNLPSSYSDQLCRMLQDNFHLK